MNLGLFVKVFVNFLLTGHNNIKELILSWQKQQIAVRQEAKTRHQTKVATTSRRKIKLKTKDKISKRHQKQTDNEKRRAYARFFVPNVLDKINY